MHLDSARVSRGAATKREASQSSILGRHIVNNLWAFTSVYGLNRSHLIRTHTRLPDKELSGNEENADCTVRECKKKVEDYNFLRWRLASMR
jgi:hypothetical protein